MFHPRPSTPYAADRNPRRFSAPLLLAITGLFLGSCVTTSSVDDAPLQPSQFEWEPERSPSGPTLLVVSLDDQMAYVYRNGVKIGRSTVSTGRQGKETPTGCFTILQKNIDHESNIYKGAAMPYMQRLTWSGICMHAGDLPGYPASAGCVRLPYEFSKLVYDVTAPGSTVVITRKRSVPTRSSKPVSALLADHPDVLARPGIGEPFWNPSASPSGPVSMLLSGADQRLDIYRNGRRIGSIPVTLKDPARPIPEGVFIMMEGLEANTPSVSPGRPARAWSVVSLSSGGGDPVAELRDRLDMNEAAGRDLYDVLSPGAILVTTAQKSTQNTRSEPGFTIMN